MVGLLTTRGGSVLRDVRDLLTPLAQSGKDVLQLRGPCSAGPDVVPR
jgi:hypothetical protein